MDGVVVDSVVIRPAVTADIEAVGRLWTNLVDYHVALDHRLPSAVPNGGRRYARRLYDKLDDPFARLLVADAGGQVVGFVLGMIVDLVPDVFEQEPSGFLADIYVDAAYRRHGIGRRLVEALMTWFQERGVTYYELHVAALNAEGLAFWRALESEPVMVRMRTPVSKGNS
jgi:ribosomal protein S18 acetylase RimI-like enzyme